ncbi:ATP-binding cassette domain-containing protein, partial [Desulfamplus magnetovallimortis]|uniref:ATP-binding cassette domain-containing protein n=1 Tax=Desulfamplus magnetovallimortis TaxID=1246637 RepID=UPI00111A46D0
MGYKKNTAIVSSRFHLDYRVSSTVIGVVVSGFFDSVGLYKIPSESQKRIAMEWLAVTGMETYAKKPFRRLSYGEQRMVLIARAMVKHPLLLILDEPCQGLDDINRKLVLNLIDKIGQGRRSTLLYVTHHEGDHLECISSTFRFVPDSSGKMNIAINSKSTP